MLQSNRTNFYFNLLSSKRTHCKIPHFLPKFSENVISWLAGVVRGEKFFPQFAITILANLNFSVLNGAIRKI